MTPDTFVFFTEAATTHSGNGMVYYGGMKSFADTIAVGYYLFRLDTGSSDADFNSKVSGNGTTFNHRNSSTHETQKRGQTCIRPVPRVILAFAVPVADKWGHSKALLVIDLCVPVLWIKILGIASSCQCVRIENNLKLVNSYATARIGISVAVEQFEVKQEVRVFTDHPDFPVIKISILPAR